MPSVSFTALVPHERRGGLEPGGRPGVERAHVKVVAVGACVIAVAVAVAVAVLLPGAPDIWTTTEM
jgi:hypothetical protein